MADRLALAHALEGGGFRRPDAEKIATIIARTIRYSIGAAPDLEMRRTRLAAALARGGIGHREAAAIAATVAEMVRERHG